MYPNKDNIITQFKASVPVPRGLVDIQIGDKITKYIVDTGTIISVIKRSVIGSDLSPPADSTTIRLMPAFGDNVQATLANLPLSVVRPNGKH